MSSEKKSFVNVDELMQQISLEQAASYYGVPLPELKRIGAETRAACFLVNCGKTQATGDRALAIQEGHPAKQWKCFQYGCTKSGNLVALCDLLKPGANSGSGRPRGQRFKEIAADLKAMVEGRPGPETPSVPMPPPATAEPKVNIPLAESENERARALTDLDRKFVVEVKNLSPEASAYFRRRAYLTEEVCRTWRIGYLPRDVAGEDKSGGTLRGKVTYPYFSESGDILCWFGRDPGFEAKHAKWQKGDKSEKEPAKFTFPKGMHRGLELWNQHGVRQPESVEKLKTLGFLPLVEGPNDVIRLDTLGVPAVALCSNTITREQAAKTARLARELAGGVVALFLDCDPEGLNGTRQCLGFLGQLAPVRLVWTDKMYGGKFKGRQPESLSTVEWTEIRDYLVSGNAEGWSLS